MSSLWKLGCWNSNYEEDKAKKWNWKINLITHLNVSVVTKLR